MEAQERRALELHRTSIIYIYMDKCILYVYIVYIYKEIGWLHDKVHVGYHCWGFRSSMVDFTQEITIMNHCLTNLITFNCLFPCHKDGIEMALSHVGHVVVRIPAVAQGLKS